MQAHYLSLNSFGMHKVGYGVEAMYTKIVYLLLLDPGKFQSHPEMGVGLRRRFRDNNDENLLRDLQSRITNQIKDYLPELSFIEITVSIKDTILVIVINTEGGAYYLTYDTEKDIIEAPASYVLEDL